MQIVRIPVICVLSDVTSESVRLKVNMSVLKKSAKMWVCSVLLITALTVQAWADSTFVSTGNVSGNWTTADSPYIVQGNLTVAASDSLVIGSGVRVYFDSTYSILINGYLAVDGTAGDTVVFTTDTLSNPGKWRGLSFVNAYDSSYFRLEKFE